MNLTQCQAYSQQKPEAELSYPFDPDVPVYKVCGKMFALFTLKGNYTQGKHPQMNLKCLPHHAQELRDVFDTIKPGYHMNKQHWNSLVLDGSLPDTEIQRLIDHSYALVVSKLPKTARNRLETLYSKDKLYAGLSPYQQQD
ncbi:MmcQ/YjbR family DNA-binding protein [Oceaniserpentilla sp. 4NH20-0058]|uniref:MmcQ/YjbR family DNA-binding protein n=1 Tax=Oceaniserpentilla sp. 4NH20-0058 TaxID=3127660 RepID=UPI00310841A0